MFIEVNVVGMASIGYAIEPIEYELIHCKKCKKFSAIHKAYIGTAHNCLYCGKEFEVCCVSA